MCVSVWLPMRQVVDDCRFPGGDVDLIVICREAVEICRAMRRKRRERVADTCAGCLRASRRAGNVNPSQMRGWRDIQVADRRLFRVIADDGPYLHRRTGMLRREDGSDLRRA